MAEPIVRRPRINIEGATEHPGARRLDPPIVGGPDSAPTAVIRRQRDGTEKLTPNPPSATQFAVGLDPQQQERTLDSTSAMQIGLWNLLRGARAVRIGLDDYLNNNDLQSDTFGIERVFFDWPRWEDAIDPMPSLALTLPEEETYSFQGLGGGLILEDTIDQWGPGTVLKKTGTAETTIHAAVWTAHKEERRGLKKMLQDLLLTEPHEEMSGRRVVVPQYFDRVARYELEGIRYDDTPESAQSNEWIMIARISASIDIVQVVGRPPYMQQPTTNVEV